MELNKQYLQRLMESSHLRCDDATTAVLSRQLEAVISGTYDIEYSTLRARQFIPFDDSLPDGAESWVYRSWDSAGMAKIIANEADDLPLVDLNVTETPKKFVELGAAYKWSIQDLKRAAYMNTPLQDMKAKAARNAIERKIDSIAAIGVAEMNVEGFANNSNVPQVAATAAFSGATADQMLADLHKVEQAVIDNTKQNWEPDSIILPTADYGKVSTTRASANSDLTVLQYFLRNAQSVKNVGSWNKLETADAGSARAVCYKRSPEVVRFMAAYDFEQVPPEKRNLVWLVNCIAKVGGTNFFRPLAAAYLDGI